MTALRSRVDRLELRAGIGAPRTFAIGLSDPRDGPAFAPGVIRWWPRNDGANLFVPLTHGGNPLAALNEEQRQLIRAGDQVTILEWIAPDGRRLILKRTLRVPPVAFPRL